MRVALGVEYFGEAYCGWQRQTHSPSVQEKLEQALSHIASESIKVKCAGRTDTGVHATGQVVHFDTQAERPDKAWFLGTNHHLPNDISVRWAKRVNDEFHARFSATARRYRYLIHNHRTRSAILSSGLTWVYRKLDAEKMASACPYFLGEQDFSSVRAAGCQSHSPMRNIIELNVARKGDLIILDIKANAFLHHMVRNIVGVLLAIGTGDKPPEWAQELLEQKDRRLAPATASPNGLYLVDVDYPLTFELPRLQIGPAFLA
ncbi:MAG: tRNA pseudouridine(38-40) synthase TruA [Pseudomonadota bacterium]